MSEMNGENEKAEEEVPEGASSLVDLFAPPPLASKTDDDHNDAATPSLSDPPAEAASLRNLFQPPAEMVNATGGSPDWGGGGDSFVASSGGHEKARRRSTAKSSNSSAQREAQQALLDMMEGEEEEKEETVKKDGPTTAEHPPLHPTTSQPHVPAGERTALLPHHKHEDSLETTPFGDLLRPHDESTSSGFSFSDLFMSSPSSEPTPKTSGGGRKRQEPPHHHRRRSTAVSNMPSIHEDSTQMPPLPGERIKNKVVEFFWEHLCQPTTYVGAGMFLLYHVVFCLAMGSAINRPTSSTPVVGLMAKMAACGVIFASPVYIWNLGSRIPALYPTTDLFSAPFLAKLAVIVDSAVAADDSIAPEDETQVFLATFAVLSGIGVIISGSLLILAAKFKLANLGSFLPYPVLCGFFSAVGLLMWSLAFKVDTNGKGVGAVFMSGDSKLIWNSLMHHFPSVLIAVIMKLLGPKNPFYVSLLVIGTIAMFYIVMFLTGTTLEEAKALEWFWTHDELVYQAEFQHFGFTAWAPPAPFGVLNSLVEKKVLWAAVSEGLSTVCALGFLYLIRCSLHGLSLKKNVSNLCRLERSQDSFNDQPSPPSPTKRRHSRSFSEVLDIEAIITHKNVDDNRKMVRAKNHNVPLKDILMEYGRSQYVCALVGSFGVTPSVAASPTMFSVGAEKVAPQYGSVLLLAIFYLTNFQLVGYIPKAAFSCLIVLAFLDIFLTWFVKSFSKTEDKTEWLVVPIIVVSAFVVGLLNAVFLGIAMSTFLFVASFFKTGVVKYVANGRTIRSTIERSAKSANWLDTNGDLIQVLVLQNYLFFGNASSILSYITTMFEDPEMDDGGAMSLSPPAKYVILDFTLVTGLDTSTVDVLSDIKTQCNASGCKLFLAGLSPRLRNVLARAGLKPETGERSKRKIRFFPDLDSAMGKAEDMLLSFEIEENKLESLDGRRHRRLLSEGDNGFRFALRQIDEQHGQAFAMGLLGLQPYTSPIELAPGESLFSSYGGQVNDSDRGLFFIEQGIMKIERDSSVTLTRATSSINLSAYADRDSLTKMNARAGPENENRPHHFRLARVGPGWVVGTLEGMCHVQHPGHHVAVSHCRLHHLPFTKVEELEEKDPSLVLRLYKLLALLMGKRQEITIGQLSTLHSIMTAPPLKQPVRRETQVAIQHTTQSQSRGA